MDRDIYMDLPEELALHVERRARECGVSEHQLEYLMVRVEHAVREALTESVDGVTAPESRG